jgi:hypothetical protein
MATIQHYEVNFPANIATIDEKRMKSNYYLGMLGLAKAFDRTNNPSVAHEIAMARAT